MIRDTINVHVKEVCIQNGITLDDLKAGKVTAAVAKAYFEILEKGSLFCPATLSKYVGIATSRCSTISTSYSKHPAHAD